jgi:hypothetical protein
MSDRTINRISDIFETVVDFACLAAVFAVAALWLGVKSGAV